MCSCLAVKCLPPPNKIYLSNTNIPPVLNSIYNLNEIEIHPISVIWFNYRIKYWVCTPDVGFIHNWVPTKNITIFFIPWRFLIATKNILSRLNRIVFQNNFLFQIKNAVRPLKRYCCRPNVKPFKMSHILFDDDIIMVHTLMLCFKNNFCGVVRLLKMQN